MPSPIRISLFALAVAVSVSGCSGEAAPYHSYRMLGLAHQAERDQQDAERAAERVSANHTEIESELGAVRSAASGAKSDAFSTFRRSGPVVHPRSDKPKAKLIRHPEHPVESR